MAIRIQLRRDVAAAWTLNNPVLLAGEFGVESDTLKVKVGDGITAWVDLDYAVALPADISGYVQAEVAAVIDSAPGALDTLNELAAALGDDPNFSATITNALATDVANLTAHTGASTNVHGIANTAALETQSGALDKTNNALSLANAFTTESISTFDPLPDQVGNAGKYLMTDGTDTEWGTVDVAGAVSTHNSDTTDVHGIADTSLLETQSGAQSKANAAESSAISTASADATSKANAAQAAAEATAAADATSKANAAQSAAEAYADSLATNYDLAGSADAAQSAAQTYADNAVTALVDSAPAVLDTLNELAAALGDDPNFATSVASQIALKADSSALSDHVSDTTSVHGISDTANLVYTSDSRLSDTRTPTDNTVSTAKIVDGAVTSAKIADGTIVDGDVNASAAIAQSKVANLTTDLAAKAALASPTFTGTPAAPTAAVGTNTTQVATTAFVNAEISNDAVLKSGSTMTGSLNVVSPTAAGSTGVRQTTISTSAPTGGADGDVWIVYA